MSKLAALNKAIGRVQASLLIVVAAEALNFRSRVFLPLAP
jgi:hypothetical protein